MKCIPVKMSDGSIVQATVDDDVNSLSQSDIDALEEWVQMVKARHSKRKAKKIDLT